MAESIRSLTVKLGYDVDTTGADIFKARFKSLTSSLQSISKSLQRQLAPKKLIKIGPLERRIKLFGTRFRRAMRKALRLSPKQFSNLEKDLAFLGKKVKAGFDRIKVIALAGAAAIAAATFKIFTGFADIEQARLSLEFRAGDRFDEVSEKLKKIREETGGVVSELDALNAFNLGADIIGDFDFLADNFGTVIKLAKVLGKDVGEVQQAFANFIATGSNLQELVKFGFFTPQQIDALRKASTDFSQQGLETRKALLGVKIAEGAPRLQEKFNKFLDLSNASIDKFKTTVEDTTVIIGEKLNPAINDWFRGMTSMTELIKQSIKEGSFNPIIEANKTAGQLGRPTTGPNALSNINNETTININVNGAENPKVTAEEVIKAQSKAINENNIRKLIPQSLNTNVTPQRSF